MTRKKNRARSKAATIGYIVFFVLIMLGLLGGMFTFLSMSLCAPLAGAGMDWMYFALMSLLAIFLGAFGSVFNTYSGLYLAKDNDLLLSMPIPVSVIMTRQAAGRIPDGPDVFRRGDRCRRSSSIWSP